MELKYDNAESFTVIQLNKIDGYHYNGYIVLFTFKKNANYICVLWPVLSNRLGKQAVNNICVAFLSPIHTGKNDDEWPQGTHKEKAVKVLHPFQADLFSISFTHTVLFQWKVSFTEFSKSQELDNACYSYGS